MATQCPKCKAENPDTSSYCADCGTRLGLSKDIPAQTRTLVTPSQDLSRGTTIAGRYEIIERLGTGGMGSVYRVEDKKIHEDVALKLIKPEIAADKKIIERFSNELKVARKVAHRNVCKMYDIGESEGAHFITMEYVPGEDLKSFMRRSKQLSIPTVISIAKQICEGLDEAHKLGIVHRDLKPSNIMIDKDGNVHIMDFGIARSAKTEGITGTGVMIGTPEYMSPEQVEGKDVDQRSDIYSLGVILYEMVAGRIPFEGETALSIAMRHKSEAPRDPKEYNAQIPVDLNNIILKCLEKDKDSRCQGAGEMLSELDNIEKDFPTTEKVIPKRKQITSKEITVTFGLKKLYIPILIVITLVITGVIVWRFFQPKEVVAAPKIENSIAVISFENQTGDNAYDHLKKVIPNLLITNLENTGYFHVATWERLHDLLKQIGNRDVEIIERDLGFELCRMEGIEAIVLGSYAKAGNMFATDVKVLDVESKRLLKSASSMGEGIDSILRKQIDELTKSISMGLGLGEENIEAVPIQITDVTTSSIEAYNKFLEGRNAFENLYYNEAQEFLNQALELDPDFAVAYLYLARVYRSLRNNQARAAALKKAKEFSEKATEKERRYIEVAYASDIEINQDKSIQILEDLVKKYPKEKRFHYDLGWYLKGRNKNRAVEEFKIALELDPNWGFALNQLAYVYIDLEEFESAIEYFKKYALIQPDEANPIDSMADAFYFMGKLDEAIDAYKEALEIKPDFYISCQKIHYIYALKENYQEGMRFIDNFIEMAPSSGVKYQGYLWKGLYDSWLGRLEQSIIDLQNAEELADAMKNKSNRAYIEWLKGWIYYDINELEDSRRYHMSWPQIYTERYPEYESFYRARSDFSLGLIDLKEGNLDSARNRLEAIKSALNVFDSPEIVQRLTYYNNLLNIEILLAEGFYTKAKNVFVNTSPLKPPVISYTTEIINYNLPFISDLLPRIYLKEGKLDNAIAEYERLITFNPNSSNRRLIHPRYHYKLARLFEEKGLKEKAIEHYEKFLDLWKDADPGIAEVEDARESVAALKKSP